MLMLHDLVFNLDIIFFEYSFVLMIKLIMKLHFLTSSLGAMTLEACHQTCCTVGFRNKKSEVKT